MAGIKGQPSGNPAQLKSPVPTTAAPPAFDDFEAPPSFDDFAMGETGGEETAGTGQEVQSLVDPNSTMGGVLQTAADWAPTVGGVVGSIGGAGAGGVGAIPGAVLGGVGGQSLRRLIEVNLLGKQENTFSQEVGDQAVAGMTEGAGQAVGGVIGKGIGKLAQKAAPVFEGPMKMISGALDEAREAIEKPVLEFISKNASQLTNQESGDAVKQLLTQNIKQKYGKFVDAYAGLDDVAKAVPFTDEARYKFTQKMKAQALDTLGGDDLRIVRKFMDDVDRVGNGAQISNIAMQIRDAAGKAYTMGATNRGKVLKELGGEVENFLEEQTTRLATKLRSGTGTPEEMQFLQRIMQQRGVVEPDPKKYASSLAKDYLEGRSKVKSDYAGFREFLSDVGEQTKLKATNKGPMRFLDDMDSVPSEKLVEKMFDPKNARAIANMKRETPEVFEQVRQARMRQLLQNSSPDGQLDLRALHRELAKSKYDSTRHFLLDKKQMADFTKTINDPRFKKIDSLQKAAENFMVRWSNDLGAMLDVVPKQADKIPAGIRAAAKQTTGRAAVGLGSVFAPEQPSDF